MFKKIEIWILYLVLLLAIPVTIIFGSLVRYEILGVKKYGILSKTALFIAKVPSTIRKVFYSDLKLKDRFPLLDGFNGTPTLNESYLLLSKFDGDLQEGIVELIDLRNFKVLHTWNPDIDKFNKSIEKIDQFKYLDRDQNDSRQRIKHPKLTRDGGLLFESGPLRKIDACSNLIFQNKKAMFHHSIETDTEEFIWAPIYIYPQSLPIEQVGRDIVVEEGYRDDGIVKLSSDGKILFEKSLTQIFIENNLEYLLFTKMDSVFNHDPLHLNDIQPVNFDGKFWKKGDLFLSIRDQSMVALYRPSTNKIIWKGTGPFFNQHDVDILNDHSISVFNNNSKQFKDGAIVDGHNEVIIYDFKTNQYSYYLNESLKKNDVRTIKQGRSQILPNGDLFVEETNFGRAIYFDADGLLRWTYLNRAKNGNVYFLGWSRILYDDKDITIVKNFLHKKGTCE
ncbi:arylsulfotransferase family protein [Prochlorococcus marinus]|uniref:arylsulfotransferase family protein n=1 Tax=Prochlorococcus marinus TaxID=1219 RepID=UPI00094DC82F|nr:arylsulfotransferase family protein [Prochlorococcus marinus]